MTPAVLVSVLLTVSPGEAAVADLEAFHQSIFERVAPAVVFIKTTKGFGSGVFVSHDGLILTNAHVVGQMELVDVVLHDGQKLVGRVVERASDDIDLALVEVAVKNSPSAEVNTDSKLRVGNWVAAIGHGEGAVWTFNVGSVSNIYSSASEKPVFQTQIPLNPGNSGGPILDRRGTVVGIVTAGIKEANSINFGIDIGVALRSLSRLRSQCECLTVTAPAGVPIFVQNKNVGTGKVVVPAKAGPYTVFAVVDGKMIRKTVTYPDVKSVELKAEVAVENTPSGPSRKPLNAK
jgi:S1-C subfamily serine protease